MSPHRIVLSYPFGGPAGQFGKSCVQALRNLGHHVAPFDSSWEPLFASVRRTIARKRNSPFGSRDPLSPARDAKERKLESLVKNERPDILLLIRGDYHDREFIRYLKAQYKIALVIGWWIEGPKWLDAMLADAAMCDLYFCMHTVGYQQSGLTIAYLPAAAIDRTVYYSDDAMRRDLEVTFVGTWNKRRQEFLVGLTELQLNIYGPGWTWNNLFRPRMLRSIKSGGVYGTELAHLYRRTCIGIDIRSWQTQGALTLRVLEIPSCGALLLAQNDPALEDYFRPGREIDVFTSADELVSKAKYYTVHAGIREKMARAAYQRTLELPSFEDKMRQLLAAAK